MDSTREVMPLLLISILKENSSIRGTIPPFKEMLIVLVASKNLVTNKKTGFWHSLALSTLH